MDKQPIPETLLQAVRQFADPEVAHAFFVQYRWPNGIACPRMGCGSAEVTYLAKYRRWNCRECKRQFTAKVGTIFEDSPIGLDKWLPAFWLLASNRNGISSHELGRGLGVTQKTAWFMLHRIREALGDDSADPFTGTVEADETYMGGKWENKPKHKRAFRYVPKAARDAKTPVFGIVQRGGRVRAWKVDNVTAKTLLPKLRASIDPDATLYTDSATMYTHINEYFMAHSSVNHSIEEYVRGNVHTNTIECFWAVLKRTIGGTYTHVSPKHLDRYLAEQVFRFDERENEDGWRFVKATKRADGKRLTYKKLIAK
ncbi:MAG TPA: IS1595 family transposase [Candidatus Acidoferrales bacterium]|nr:IS1595 family transposase [Candidatus Acidoferrales bacterium]